MRFSEDCIRCIKKAELMELYLKAREEYEV